MWMPGGILYTGIAAWLFIAWLRAVERETVRREGHARVQPPTHLGTSEGE